MNRPTPQAREEAEQFLEKSELPAVYALRTRRVQDEFWPKLRNTVGRMPFAQDLAAAYYAARDPQTPASAKASLISALFYFVTPGDLIPDFIAGLGAADDTGVLAVLIALSAAHIQDKHRSLAKIALKQAKITRPGAK